MYKSYYYYYYYAVLPASRQRPSYQSLPSLAVRSDGESSAEKPAHRLAVAGACLGVVFPFHVCYVKPIHLHHAGISRDSGIRTKHLNSQHLLRQFLRFITLSVGPKNLLSECKAVKKR